MKTYEITNANVSYYVDSIWIPVNATEQEINDALDNAEMDIAIKCEDWWDPAPWEALHFDYESPDTKQEGTSSLVGYLNIPKYCEMIGVSLKYKDAWGVEQDKIPLIIQAAVENREED